MKRTMMIITALLALSLASCASTDDAPFSALEQQQIAAVEFMRPYELSRTDVSFTAMGEVIGVACQSSVLQPSPSQAEALLQLKLAAAQLGANRVILKQCQQGPSEGCRSSWICRGDAHQQQPLR